MGKKLTIEYIRKAFEAAGYTLLSDEYNSIFEPLDAKCSNGHNFKLSAKHLLYDKRGCKYCNNALYFKDIVKSFESEGYKLLTKESEYKNSKQLLRVRCPKDHEYSVSYSHWSKKNGSRCKKCYFDSLKITFEDFVLAVAKENYTVLDSKPNNFDSKTYVKCKCSCGHIYNTCWNVWRSGHRCKLCAYDGLAKKYKFDVSYIRQQIEDEDYILLNETYSNAFDTLKIKCDKGHIYYANWNAWQQGNRCPKCTNNFSSGHEELSDFLNTNGFKHLLNDRTIIKPYELDIVIPNKKVAIEYCGLYWHSELSGKDKKYHIKKLDMCKKIGYSLITIFEDEWRSNKELVKSRLLNILNCSVGLTRLYARNCSVKEIPTALAKDFCDKNHLQGYTGSRIKLGAFYKGELVAVMTFAKPSISKGYKNYKLGTYELSRYCSKKSYQIVGIASKLLKFFERNYEWVEIFSYADQRWSTGKLYEKLGFTFVKETPPNYWYLIKGNTLRRHRYAYRKNKEDDMSLTEWENRKSQGYNRIWDCGNLKYSKTKEN